MDFLKLLKPTATHSRNGFDLSRKHVFSMKAGQAKPCLCIETVPNDHFEIDLASLTRTMTMNTAAFLRGKMRYDFFFVPYSQLWHPFNQFVSQRTDKHSANQKNHVYCPVIRLDNLLVWLYEVLVDTSSPYQQDMFGRSIVESMIDLLNLLEYGDYRWIYDPDLSRSDVMTRIGDYAGKYVNVWRLAAYQHIWYDYYRNKYYDVDATGGIQSVDSNFRQDVSMFNFDDIDCGTFANSVIPCANPSSLSSAENERIFRLLQPRFVQWKKDLFTSALPGQQFGVVSSVDIASGNVSVSSDSNRWLPSEVFNPPASKILTATDENSLSTSTRKLSHDHVVTIGNTSFDVLALRKAEMLQLWKQRTLRAGNMVDDSFKAHYGVKPYYEGDNNVDYLGSFSSTLQVNAVETTAVSSAVLPNNRVGDLAATGTAVTNGEKIDFSPRDFGVIMCIASFLPESEYNADMIEKANTLHEQFDYFTSEFENIGLEAIPLRQYRFDHYYAPMSELSIGFAPRYWMYKTAVDKVFGEFENRGFGNSLAAWVSPRQVDINISGSSPNYSFNQDISNLYVNPSVLNNIFGISVNSHPNTDQFLNNVFFDVKSLRPMSELGLPQF